VFPISYHTLKRRFDELRRDFDLHGFRSSFRDWCSVNRIDDDVAEKSIAHYKGSKTEKAYKRDDLLELRRPIMEAWARFCCGEKPVDNVVELRAKANHLDTSVATVLPSVAHIMAIAFLDRHRSPSVFPDSARL
jgi:hypothetical protein